MQQMLFHIATSVMLLVDTGKLGLKKKAKNELRIEIDTET